MKKFIALLLALPTLCYSLVVDRIDSIDLVVSDMPRLVRFYVDTLEFKVIQEQAFANMQIVTLQLGDGKINLIRYLDSTGKPYPDNYQSNDRFFQSIAITVSDMSRAYAKLCAKDVTGISNSPQRFPDWNPTMGGIVAYYFKDPDGHPLELISYPGQKGWQKGSERPIFLGIDHTSVVVYDTDKSLRFYQGELGLEVVDRSENYGQEQAALNNVQGAHLRVTRLKAKSGISIKLLQYLYPTDGKPMPLDTVFNDLWRVTLHLDVQNLNKPPYLNEDPDQHVLLLNTLQAPTPR